MQSSFCVVLALLLAVSGWDISFREASSGTSRAPYQQRCVPLFSCTHSKIFLQYKGAVSSTLKLRGGSMVAEQDAMNDDGDVSEEEGGDENGDEDDDEDEEAVREEILRKSKEEGKFGNNVEELEGLAGELPGTTAWEKLQAWADMCIKNTGKGQVDNVGIEQYGPHTVDPDYPQTWATGVFECWETTPWEERPEIGHLEWPSGELDVLKEGDLPNRRPYIPDPDDLPKKYVRPRKNYNWGSQAIAKAGGDPRKIDHWVAQLDSEEKKNMPPGGYPHPEGKTFTPDEDSSASDHSDSEMYEEIRNKVMEEYGWDSIPIIEAMDRVTNYSGTEPPPTFEPPKEGEFVVRYTAEGDVDAVVPYESDREEEGLEDLELERVHERLWSWAKAGRAKGVASCLRAGADVNAVNEYTHTALHYAAREGWTPVIDVLVAAGAEVNVETEVQMTPLHYAAYHNHTAAVWTLLRAGADLNATNMMGYTAPEIAREHEHFQMGVLFTCWIGGDMHVWDSFYGDDYRCSHTPGTYNATIQTCVPKLEPKQWSSTSSTADDDSSAVSDPA